MCPPLIPEGREALITITVHNRLTWSHGFPFRMSQHAFLASQTLGDLFDVIPCASKEVPKEIIRDGFVLGYERTCKPDGTAECVVCIEGLAYSDGQSQPDYAE